MQGGIPLNRILSLLLSAALLLGCFAGCAAEDTPYIPTGNALAAEDADVDATLPDENTEPQVLSLAYYPERSLNPYLCSDYTNRVLLSLMYQGLFAVNRSYEAVPILCDTYRASESLKTYTFYLAADAKFSDGSKVTVEDVVASYTAAKENGYYSGRFTHVREVTPSDDGGVTFSLSAALEDLPLLLDFPIVKAAQVAEDHPLGTGPYIFEDGLTGAQLRRNHAWWCSTTAAGLVVTAESIPLVAVESAINIRDEFEFADVELVLADPCADTYADFRCDYELWDCDSDIMLFLGCNVAYSQEDVFEDETFRSKLTYAIDREALVEDYYRNFAMATSIPVSPRSPHYSASLSAKYDYDPVQLINVVHSMPDTEEPLRLLVNRDDSLRLRAARAIAEMLGECGLEVQLKERSTREFNADIYNGSYDLYLGTTKLSANMDLSPFFKPYGNIARNGTSNALLYDLCLDALENSGNYYPLHKAVAEDGRIIPILFCSYAVYATRGLLTDLQPARDNVFYYTLGRTDSDALIPIDYNAENSVG